MIVSAKHKRNNQGKLDTSMPHMTVWKYENKIQLVSPSYFIFSRFIF